jgi:4-amino-4-deoxy-L-arabinose transferase-like glycosyltransferase
LPAFPAWFLTNDSIDLTGKIMSQRREVLIAFSLFFAAFLPRLWLAQQLTFPQLDDPAAYIQVARHVAQGRGLVSDVIWNYWVSFDSLTHPSNEFWMPLASVSMAAALRLLGDSFFAAQLPGLLTGSALAPLVYGMGRTLWPKQRRWSILAAVLIIPGAIVVYQSASADSSSLYTLLSTTAIFAAALAVARRRLKWAMAAGVLSGLSYLTRSHGLLLPLTIGLLWTIYLWRDKRLAVKFDLALLACYFALVIPWWLRNTAAFGLAQPVPLTTIMAAREYADWYNYTQPPTVASMLALGWPTILNLRWDAILHGLGVLLLLTFPYGVIGLPVIYLRREPLFRLFAVYGTLLFLGVTIILPTSSLTGAWYHSAGTFAAFAALGSIYVVKWLFERRRTRLLAVALFAILVGLGIGQAALAWERAIAQSQAQGRQFAEITRWLRANVPPDQPVLTTQAHSLNYASAYPALSIPLLQDAAVLRQVAGRYGVRYVVVTERNGQYPQALDLPAARARLLAEFPETWIYELER